MVLEGPNANKKTEDCLNGSPDRDEESYQADNHEIF